MSRIWKQLAGGIGAAVVGAGVAVATMHYAGPGAANGDGDGSMVRTYLLDHPEVISEAMERLQDRQTAQAIGAHRSDVETPFAGAVAGNPRGDVTLVEYYDYACGYCRQSVGDVDKLIASDPRLRVVFKEMPILAPESARAAEMSLVAAKAGKFLAYHHALYARGPLSSATIDATDAAFGLSPGGAESADIVDELNTNLGVMRSLRMSGTPTFVVGNQMLSGAVGYDALKDAVARARSGADKV